MEAPKVKPTGSGTFSKMQPQVSAETVVFAAVNGHAQAIIVARPDAWKIRR